MAALTAGIGVKQGAGRKSATPARLTDLLIRRSGYVAEAALPSEGNKLLGPKSAGQVVPSIEGEICKEGTAPK